MGDTNICTFQWDDMMELKNSVRPIVGWNVNDFVRIHTNLLDLSAGSEVLNVLNPDSSSERLLILSTESTEGKQGSAHQSLAYADHTLLNLSSANDTAISQSAEHMLSTLNRSVESTVIDVQQPSSDMSMEIANKYLLIPGQVFPECDSESMSNRQSDSESQMQQQAHSSYTSIESSSDVDADLMAIVQNTMDMQMMYTPLADEVGQSLLISHLSEEAQTSLLDSSPLENIEVPGTQSSTTRREMVDLDQHGSVSGSQSSHHTRKFTFTDTLSPSGGGDGSSSVSNLEDQVSRVMSAQSPSDCTKSTAPNTSASQPQRKKTNRQLTIFQYLPLTEQEFTYSLPSSGTSAGSSSSSPRTSQFKQMELNQYFQNWDMENQRLANVSLSANIEGLKSLPVPPVLSKKHVPRSGAPFKQAHGDDNKLMEQVPSVLDALKRVDVSRLKPPNQYSVSELRKIRLDVDIKMGNKKALLLELTNKLTLAKLM